MNIETLEDNELMDQTEAALASGNHDLFTLLKAECVKRGFMENVE